MIPFLFFSIENLQHRFSFFFVYINKMSESERFAHMFSIVVGMVCKLNDIKVGLMVAA